MSNNNNNGNNNNSAYRTVYELDEDFYSSDGYLYYGDKQSVQFEFGANGKLGTRVYVLPKDAKGDEPYELTLPLEQVKEIHRMISGEDGNGDYFKYTIDTSKPYTAPAAPTANINRPLNRINMANRLGVHPLSLLQGEKPARGHWNNLGITNGNNNNNNNNNNNENSNNNNNDENIVATANTNDAPEMIYLKGVFELERTPTGKPARFYSTSDNQSITFYYQPDNDQLLPSITVVGYTDHKLNYSSDEVDLTLSDEDVKYLADAVEKAYTTRHGAFYFVIRTEIIEDTGNLVGGKRKARKARKARKTRKVRKTCKSGKGRKQIRKSRKNRK